MSSPIPCICALCRAQGPRSVGGVAKERLKSPRARLFVALDLPDRVRNGIAAWGREQLGDPALRPVAEESLHITLAFLGYLPEKSDSTAGRDRRRGRRAGTADRARGTGPQAAAREAAPVRAGGRVAGHGRASGRARGEAGRGRALRARETPVLAARDRRQGASGGARVEAAGARLEASRGAAEGSAAALRWRPDHALPFATPAAGCAVHPAGASRAAREWAAVR